MPTFRPHPRASLRTTARIAFVSLLLSSAAPMAFAAQPGDPVAAKVNGVTIHVSDVDNFRKQIPQLQSVPLEQIYPRIITHLVEVELFSEEAKKEKLDRDPDVKKKIADAKSTILAGAYVYDLGQKVATDAALHDFYNKHVVGVKELQEIHARHILVNSEAEAKDIIAQLNKGADFATLATQKSIDKGPDGKVSDGGDLGWFSVGQMVPEFSKAAFELNKGEYTKTPVKSKFGWHVIQVLDMRTPPFDSVKDQLAGQVGDDAVSKKIVELKSKSKIEIFNVDGSPVKQ